MTDDSRQSAPSVEPVDEVVRGGAAELLHYGITAHQHTTYEWQGYRYTNVRDALAAARRVRR